MNYVAAVRTVSRIGFGLLFIGLIAGVLGAIVGAVVGLGWTLMHWDSPISWSVWVIVLLVISYFLGKVGEGTK